MILYAIHVGFSRALQLSVPSDYRVSPDALVLVTAVPVLLVAFAWISWRNFVRDTTGSKATSSYLALSGVTAAVLLVDAAIYQRAWEWVESSPKADRFAIAPGVESRRPQPALTPDGTHAILRDGTLWRMLRLPNEPVTDPLRRTEPHPIGRANDWVQVVHRGNGVFALKSDGTLWMQGNFYLSNVTLKPEGTGDDWQQDFAWHHLTTGGLREVAPGTRWRSLADSWRTRETIAIRDDGTLWMWGQPSDQVFTVDLEGAVQMTQLSGDTDWKQVVGRLGLKSDGTLWSVDGLSHLSHDAQNREHPWQPVQIRRGTRFSELMLANLGWWSSILGQTAAGEIVMMSQSDRANWLIGCPDARGESVKLDSGLYDTVRITRLEPVLTNDNVLLFRNGELDFGCAWVTLSAHGGFTRDGSYWKFERWGRSSDHGVHRIAQWLRLRLDSNRVDYLFPRRWRPKLFGKPGIPTNE